MARMCRLRKNVPRTQSRKLLQLCSPLRVCLVRNDLAAEAVRIVAPARQ
jgi:hypothetical protein